MISGVGRHFGLAGWLCGTNSLDLVCKCFLGRIELKTLNFFLRNQYSKKAFTRKKGNSQFSHESDCFLSFFKLLLRMKRNHNILILRMFSNSLTMKLMILEMILAQTEMMIW